MSEESPNIEEVLPPEANSTALPEAILESPAKKTDTDSEDVDVVVVDVEDDDDCRIIDPPTHGDVETTPTKRLSDPADDDPDAEVVYSSFPCQVIPETLSRMTRTPPDGEHLRVHRNANGRLRVYVIDNFKKFSPYSTLTHKPCTVCNRQMKLGEMHLNFPADLDRRRIWANLLGFKYKDILRSKMGPVSFSIAAGPICTEHFAEECFRNHNFNKAAIEAFGVPVAISPDVKTTPSKKSSRVPWVCTICDFHSCSVVELQLHLLEHTEQMLEKKEEGAREVPDAGFMCPFCRKCTYGYKTISGFRRHLNSSPVQHCHLRRIYEFAKLNCRSTELEPIDKWDNWTRRNVYVAYHGCEPPVNEIVLTPSPTKSAYVQNPEERTRIVHDEERRRKAVRSLAFVGKEGGTSVNDHNVMQRAVYLQVRRNMEFQKKYPLPNEDGEDAGREKEKTTTPEGEEVVNVIDDTPKKSGEAAPDAPGAPEAPVASGALSAPEAPLQASEAPAPATSEPEKLQDSPQAPMGSAPRRLVTASATSSPVKKLAPPTASLPATPLKKKRKISPEEAETSELSAESLRQQKIRDEQFAQMVAKRSQQVKRLIAFKRDTVQKKPRKALNYTLTTRSTASTSSVVEEQPVVQQQKEEQEKVEPIPTTATEPPVETRKSARILKKPSPPAAASSKSEEKPRKMAKLEEQSVVPAPQPPKPPVQAEKEKEKEKVAEKIPEPAKPIEMPAIKKEPEERPLKSMLARSLFAGVRPSMAKYHIPVGATSSTLPAGRSLSSGAISSTVPTAAPPKVGGGLFARLAQEGQQSKRPTLLARRPLILSPRKKAVTTSTTSSTFGGLTGPAALRSMIPDDYAPNEGEGSPEIISGNDLEVELVEEVTESPNDPFTTASGLVIKPTMTLAEALEMTPGAGIVKEQELEDISREMMRDAAYFRSVEDAMKCNRTATKVRAELRLSRHCMRQLEAARARARLFGEGSEGEQYHIVYGNDGAQIISKNDPKWVEVQQQQQPPPNPGDQ